jgi:hypothetical protein
MKRRRSNVGDHLISSKYMSIYKQKRQMDISRNIWVAHFNVLFWHLLEVPGNSTNDSFGEEHKLSKIGK